MLPMLRTAVIVLATIGCARSAAPDRPSDRAGGPPGGTGDPAALVVAMHRYDELVQAMDSHALAGLFVADGVIANAGQVIAAGPAGIGAFLRSFDGKVRVEATGSTVARGPLPRVAPPRLVSSAWQHRAVVGCPRVRRIAPLLWPEAHPAGSHTVNDHLGTCGEALGLLCASGFRTRWPAIGHIFR
jgi:hypothetical protein